MEDRVTNKQLYDAIQEINGKFDRLVETRISPLERTVDKLWIYCTIGVFIVSAIIGLGIDWVKKNILHI